MKLNILLVDDELNIITGLKRMLRVLKDDWQFYFATSGFEALEILETTNMHVVISDMRMPKMNGAEFLEIVKKKHPESIRIILSGQSDDLLALKSTGFVHQFIAKPIEPESLKSYLRQSLELYKMFDNENLRNAINGIGRLPTLPKIYYKIENELAKENYSLQKIKDIVKSDIVISAKILQVVNSAFFGLPQNISSVEQAINLLGTNIIKSLIIGFLFTSTFEKDTHTQQLLESIWKHSLIVAKNAIDTVRKLGGTENDSEIAYTAGLLHDIGKIAVLSNSGFREKIISLMEKNNYTYNDAEKEVLGTTHAFVGGYLLKLWGLPDKVVDAVIYHHNLIQDKKSNNIDVRKVVYFANVFSNTNNIE